MTAPADSKEPVEPAEPVIETRIDAGGTSAPPLPTAKELGGDEALAIELKWLRTTYQGDHVKQATFRAILMGALLGGALSLQNLFVGLKAGWGFGVAITACILSYTIYASLVKIAPRLFGPPMTLLENNCMQSTASSAGYSTGATMVSAISAFLMINHRHIHWLPLGLWTFFIAVLGTTMAIPMKRQMINIEQLKFPSGIAAAETLRSLHGQGEESKKQARALGWAALLGAMVAWFRDAHGKDTGVPWRDKIFHVLTLPSQWLVDLGKKINQETFPSMVQLKWLRGVGLTLAGKPLVSFTIGIEGSLLLVAAGGLMGMRAAFSMLVGAFVNFAVLAPWAYSIGAIKSLGYRGIVAWSVWPGVAIMVASGLLSFGLQWRTVARAFKGLGGLFSSRKPHDSSHEAYREKFLDPKAAAEAEVERVEVPPSWFAIGMIFSGLGLVVVGAVSFGINPFFGVIAVLMSFILAIVACRVTGETDTTPIGAMGKITQLLYGVLAPANVNTNLMTASITAGAAVSSADLLTDLKSGYLLGANPRKQFLAQLVGTVIGTVVVVPMFYVLVPTAETLGTDRFPAPAAQVWKSVAELLSKGLHELHPTARWGMVIGLAVGLVLPLLELEFPKHKKWIPSPSGLGLAFVIPFFNSLSIFEGALLAWLYMRMRPKAAEKYVVPISSGIIAGESLMGVLVVLLGQVLQWLE